MKYLFKYNAMYLLITILIKVIWPIRSFLIGLWYRIWGFESRQQHLDHFKNMPVDELLDFTKKNIRPKNLTILYSLITNTAFRENLNMFTCIAGALTSLGWGFEHKANICKYLWLYPAIETETDHLEFIDMIRGSVPGTTKRALLHLGVSEEVLLTFCTSNKNFMLLEDHVMDLGILKT